MPSQHFKEHDMKLSSLSFSDNESIPERYAFGKIDAQSHVALADNYNPQFSWDDVPAGTQSFALICHDPDVPSKPDDVNQEGREVPADLPRVDFFHWVLVDTAADMREIDEGAFPAVSRRVARAARWRRWMPARASTRTRPGSPTTTT